MDWLSLTEAGWFITVLRSSPPQLSDPGYPSTVLCVLIICNDDCVFSNVGVYQIEDLSLSNYLTDSKIRDIN